MTGPTIPPWMTNLNDEDLTFIKRFLLASGSMKEVAAEYGVSYPTVRLRLDRLIQKIQLGEQLENEPYIALIKRLAVDDRLDFGTAKILITEYRKQLDHRDQQ
ncbi:hypothetical protein DSM100688_0883 [Bifidobacterium ramosum]|uniref:DUF2089 family protein n=1 Tax=Bifidobacterium ramosum TaxID=1798158 RepID=A0A6L4X192_9BIFI|nr:DUF2089 family protein [Bifidobacterium ramosum]KAB8288316.1 hypothetical protein DSM100688_0883 [Bifidobacterium ramosum]NEG71646.1 DUF2089 family protein [Bifidobacterium ramosum]